MTHQAREVFADGASAGAAKLGMDWSTTSATTSPSSRRTRSTAASGGSASTARARRAPSRRATRRSPRRTARSASRCIIPGDMGPASWVLAGQPGSMERDVRHDLPRRRPA